MFDSTEELLRQIRLGEDSSLEFKTARFRSKRLASPKRNDLADEIAAIANTQGGVMLFGVDDVTRQIVGVPLNLLDVLERAVFEICNDSIKPPVAFHVYRLELPDHEDIPCPMLKVEIPRSLFVHLSPGGYLERLGSSKRVFAPERLARLFQQRSQARIVWFDQQPVPESSFQDLERDLWQRFSGDTEYDAVSILRKMKILSPDDSGAIRATVAGALMCMSNPSRWLPSAFIQAVRYRGRYQDSNYQIDAKDFRGPADKQIWDALSFVKQYMRIEARKDPARTEIPQFSVRAVYEAVANAVVHRDYSISGSQIRLFLFDDRLELYSPGSLPNSVTVEDLAMRQSTRNELLTWLLSKCRTGDRSTELGRRFLVEKRGDGVPIILRESHRISGRDPEYRLIGGAELLLTIYSASMKSYSRKM